MKDNTWALYIRLLGASNFPFIIAMMSVLNLSLHRIVRKVSNLMYVACVFLYLDQVQVRDFS